MKRVAIIILLFVIMLAGMAHVFPTNKPVVAAIGGGPFGGKITFIQTCDDGIRKYLTLSPPIGGPFIYTPPARYLHGEPSHVGQWLLGLSPGSDVCSISTVPFPGKKMFILFGSSK